MSNNEDKFKQLLRELFQFARADLNFGIYRIMNHKREQMEQFIDNDIIAVVNDAIQSNGNDHAITTDTDECLNIVANNLGVAAFDKKGRIKPDFEVLPMAKVWQFLQDGCATPPLSGMEELKSEVFNALHLFFSRYYDEGDFICKQRYTSSGRYAVPYNGEEVLFHWANKEQYYIKTAEYFKRYEYKLNNNDTIVRFEMRSAELEYDNNKSSEKKYFIILADKLQTPGKTNNAYVLPFEYRQLTSNEKKKYSGNQSSNQDKIIKDCLATLRGIKKAASLFDTPPPPPIFTTRRKH